MPLHSSARVLCVGNELELLQTRCAVLSHSGFDTQSSTVGEAETLLYRERFDLIIVSAWLSKSETERILSAAGETATLLLEGLTLAPDLIAEVERRLSPRDHQALPESHRAP